MNASLDEKLKSVKWGEFRLGDLFQFKGIKQSKSQKDIPFDEKGIPYIVQSSTNNMCGRYVNKQYLLDTNEPPVKGNAIVLGVTLPAVSYQPKEFGASQVIEARADFLNEKNGLFFAISISKQMHRFSYQNKPGIEIYKNLTIQLPIRQPHEIDFDFMESFISELEQERINKLNAYLEASGLKDYELTEEEEKILKDCDKWQWREFTFIDVFNNIKQGRRLKKEDQQEGDIPFVMSGTTNTGVVNYISNPVALFPSNSITVDIFGNTFYRNYEYGAGDDTGVYWNNEKNYSKLEMLFFTTSMKKTLSGKFDFGNKLRSSQSDNIKMQLPTQNSLPDYKSMETFIRAIEKLVIKDVVLYAEKKLGTMKEVAYSQSSASTLAAEASSYQSNCGGDN